MKFKQSCSDFPLTVSLGHKAPDWGLSRWAGNSGLRFLPLDDEGYSLRGNKKILLYKGRERSHRFTILGDTAFEYDCILKHEPDSNVISLVMEGAENYDFFRQPDFVKDPFLKGSYAVYKKETLIGEGTGKLCHIHRPKIIDALGRYCWGDLSIAGNRLNITIPEYWLGEAKYPVIVDPTIGTSTVGSQITGPNPDNPTYDRPVWDGQVIGVCKYPVLQTGNGICTAYVYFYYDRYYSPDYCYPILFNDSGNKPYKRISRGQERIWPTGNQGANLPLWLSGRFTFSSITAGSNIWFGVFATWFTTRFDYGGDFYKFDTFDENWLDDDLPEYAEVNNNYTVYQNIKFSWYFDYAAQAQNYVRTLTQGVKLTDNRTAKVNFLRSLKQTTKITDVFKRNVTFYRKCANTANNTMGVNRFQVVLRLFKETAANTQRFRNGGSFFRNLFETEKLNDEPKHEASYYRNTDEIVQAETNIIRSLFMRLCIVTKVFIRDYLLSRFLKAKQELVLKSVISREITLDSRIE